MFLFLCSACTQQYDNAIRFGLSTAPVTLDPRYATDAVSHRINRLIYRRLVDFDENFHVVPSLANWEQLEPSLYRFTLGREGRRFHNGDYLTANDVKATYDFILDPANVSPHLAVLSMIERIEAVDDDTIDFYLHDADPLFPGRVVIGILPQRLIVRDHPFLHSPVGSGTVKFMDWPGENNLKLQRLSDAQEVHFITVKDPTVRVLKLLRGEIDLIQGDLPFELLAWLKENHDITVETEHGNTFTYLGFNMNNPVLGQLIVRQAIACALDRAAIIKYVLGGAARKAGTLLPPGHWSGHPALDGYAYNPAESRKLLKQAGYDLNNPLRFTYKTSNNPLRVRLATIIQYQLQQVGISVDIRSYDWGTFYGDIKTGNFQMYSLSWVGLNTPDIFRYVFHSSSIPPTGANRGRYNDATVDTLIEMAEKHSNLQDQANIYRKLQEYLHEQLPYIPLWYEDNILARRKNITGYTLFADGSYDGLLNAQKTVIGD
ncbi:MAG: ABC transporter substrate-binding protein [Gammaproteobacteria bacterium]|nr:ABC transporter substrate-binding protein [Gammaproteobacteria bacterium]